MRRGGLVTSFVAVLLLGVTTALLFSLPWGPTTAAAMTNVNAEEDNYYEILGLGEERDDASEDKIKSAWRKLSKKHHPDIAGESHREVYQRIQRAYEVLGDRRRRKVYDILGPDGLSKFEHSHDQPQQHMHPSIFFFGGQQNAERGKNEEMLLVVSLEDVYSGTVHTVQLTKTKICRACRGTGARSKEDLQQCKHCNGQGRVVRRVQFAPGFVQQMEQPCGHCHGKGRIVKTKCPVCQGLQTVRSTSSLSIDIEQGIPDGHTLTYELEADQQPNQVPGDVIFTVNTAPHPRLTRNGDDLTTTVVLTLKEALLGFQKVLPHLDGHEVELVESGVVQHGAQRRVVGEGMPRHHIPSERGDLHVIYEVELPSLLTASQRELVERVFS